MLSIRRVFSETDFGFFAWLNHDDSRAVNTLDTLSVETSVWGGSFEIPAQLREDKNGFFGVEIRDAGKTDPQGKAQRASLDVKQFSAARIVGIDRS